MRTQTTYLKGIAGARVLSVLATAALAASIHHALGASLTVTNLVGIPTTQVNWTGQEVRIPKFDHNLGTLTQVRLDVVANVRSTPKIENLTPAPRVFVFGSQSTVILQDPDRAPLVTTQPQVWITRSLGAFDGTANFAADIPGLPSGIVQNSQSAVDQRTLVLNASNNGPLFSQFVNSGSPNDPQASRLTLYANANGTWKVSGGLSENSDFKQDIKTEAGLNVYVIYTYVPDGYTLSGRVWNDIDQNGIQDAGEPGIPGLTVNLLYGSDLFSDPGPILDDSGSILAGTSGQVTDADGNYRFSGFLPADVASKPFYSVQVAPPQEFTVNTATVFGLSPDGVLQRSTVDLTVDVDAERSKTDINFGLSKPLARVSGTVWADANKDGVQDPAESGLAGISVKLTTAAGVVVQVRRTDSTGRYCFYGLTGDADEANKFTVSVVPPAFYQATFDADDGFHATPGAGFNSLHRSSFGLAPGAVEGAQNFGYFNAAQVGDRVWNDLNADGVQDAGEPGIPGVVVTLTGGTNLLTTTTDLNGYYAFSSAAALPEGTYTVTATPPPGFRQTFDLDDGWQLLSFNTPNATTVTLTAGQIRSDVDFGYSRPSMASGTISDRVWSDKNADGQQDSGEVGIPDAIVMLFNAAGTDPVLLDSRTTDTNGFYAFTDLAAGTYLVTVSNLPNYRAISPNPSSTTMVLPDGALRDDVDFGFQPLGSIGDLVWVDTNGNGLPDESPLTGVPGAIVTLSSPESGVQTTNVSASGAYSFSGLLPGTYTVSVSGVASDYSQTAGPLHAVNLAAGESNLGVDFGFKPASQAVKNSSVAGVVWLDANGDGIAQAGVGGELGIGGVLVQLRKGVGLVSAFTTGPDGIFSFTGLEAGAYNLSLFNLAGDLVATYDFDDGLGPVFNTVNGSGLVLTDNQNLTKVNFGYRRSGTVAGRVWNDADSNFLIGNSESGLVGWPVKLTDAGGATMAQGATDGSGSYSFKNLGAGTYRVVVSPLAQYTGTYDLDGVATPNTAQIVLAAAEVVANANFGYAYSVPAGSIGDRIWNDVDGDGVQDNGETGLVGVTVTLKQGSSVVTSATTGANGVYRFNSLSPGTYVLAVTPPNGYVETAGLDGLTTGVNLATVMLSAGQNRDDVDFGYRLPPANCVVPTGSITSEHWSNVSGRSCSKVPVTSLPSSVTGLTSFESAQNCGSRYARRVRGYIVPPTTGEYTFWVAASDNCELYLSSDHNSANKKKVCETSSGCGFREWNRDNSQKSVKCTLTAGVPYYVELLHKQDSGSDHCSVSWSKPGESSSRPSEIIPSKCLAPVMVPLCEPACAGTGLAGSYYRNTSLTPPVSFTRVDSTIDFTWGGSGPASNFPGNDYSVSWVGQVEAPVNGSYKFSTTADDGLRLWVNGKQLINNWSDRSAADNSGEISLNAGQKYSIKLEYYHHNGCERGYNQRSGGSVVKLRWSYPGQGPQIVPTCRLYPTAGQPSTPTVVKCEAENGNHSSNGGYHRSGCGYSSPRASGGSAVGWLENVGSYCEVSCVAPSSGTYRLKLRCSNGNSTPCTRSVYVNGVKCGTITHGSTGDWETYGDSSTISVNLNSGSNTIKVCRDYSSQSGSMDIDYIECSK